MPSGDASKGGGLMPSDDALKGERVNVLRCRLKGREG